MINKIVAYLAYPLTIFLGLALHFYLMELGYPLQVSTYIPVIIGALIITSLELKFPHRKEWLPDTSDIKNDLIFMGLVQIVLPKILSFFVVITLLGYLTANEISLTGYWPHQLPTYLQVILMLLSADFLRYWLHRAAHNWNPLWRLHEVHHSPHKLYWVNVGRFHPIEKALQFLFDALPFIILGVSEEVLALYFIFYAINGFFQHCNIELRLGFLNYLISGPELHRWHHSMVVKEGNKNYGNNLIIWDVLFGTRFLPKDREVNKLGLKNRQYPLDFVNQMRTPFIKDKPIDQD